VGGLAGAAIAPAAVRRWGPRATVAVTLPTIGAAPIVIAGAPTTITVATCLVLAGTATPCAAVAIVTHRQRTTPVHLLGRVNAAFQTLGIGAATFGAVAAASLQRALTHRQTVALIAVAGLTTLTALRPARALSEHPPPPQT
jgi:MFS family permease